MVTPADAIVKACHNLTKAIQGMQNTKGTAQLDALTWLEEALSLQHCQVIDAPPQATVHHTRVQLQLQMLVVAMYNQDPMVPMMVVKPNVTPQTAEDQPS